MPSAYLNQQIEDKDYGGSLWKQTTVSCIGWLDTKPSNSVTYVSFGSMAEISAKQVEELAWGLIRASRPFVWVMKESEKDKLPPKFLSLTSDGTGLIVTWCNQLEVLAHRATGCFVTHCGWNSTLEGLSLGVPMVGVPQWSDQPMNAKMVEDVWRVGVRAKKNAEGIVSREEVERSIREVMDGMKSEDLKKNSRRWKDLALSAVSRGASSEMNIARFIQTLQKL